MPLSDHEIEAYHRDGLVIPSNYRVAPATLAQVIDDDQVDLDQARDIVLEAGQISLHDVYLVHASDANHSEQRRMGLVLRIMPATSFYNHNSGKIKEDAGSPHGYSNRALFLLRGEDRSRRNNFSLGHE